MDSTEDLPPTHTASRRPSSARRREGGSRWKGLAVAAVGAWVVRMGFFFFCLYVAGALGVFGDPSSTRIEDVVIAVVIVGLIFLVRRLTLGGLRRSR